MKPWKLALGLIVVSVTFLLTYKVEHVQETCINTGSTTTYKTYYSLYTSEKVLVRSWVEEALIREQITIPDRKWKKTASKTSNLLYGRHSNLEVPPVYQIRVIDLEYMDKKYTNKETLELAKNIAFGSIEEHKKTIHKVLSLQ